MANVRTLDVELLNTDEFVRKAAAMVDKGVIAERDHLAAQIDRLAEFMEENYPYVLRDSEGAVDAAIRLLSTWDTKEAT